jgi:hypothetical protein
MDTIIFIPGFAGSSLILNGDVVWPPTAWEYIFGYNRLDELMDPNAQKNGVIDTTYCFPIYQPIDDDLNTIAAQMGATMIDFDFDWRQDIFKTTMPLLAQTIADCYADGARSIALVCHSIGGLVARLLLESNTYNNNPNSPTPPWFTCITQFVGICNPHLGAPLIDAEALGLLGFQGIAASDMPALGADPRYPGSYQALPAPGYNRLRQQPGNLAIDIYTTLVDGEFGPNSSNIQAAISSFSALDFASKPPTVQYNLIAGTQQQTIEQVDDTDSVFSQVQDACGDGTVPLWSAAPGPIAAFVTPGDHIGILKTDAFRQQLFQILTGGTVTPAPYAAVPVVAISMNKQIYAPGEMISVLVIPDKPSDDISGTLRISRAAGESFKRFSRYVDREIRYIGGETTHLSMQIEAPSKPGVYRMTFEGDKHRSAKQTFGGFAVSPSAAPRQRRR